MHKVYTAFNPQSFTSYQFVTVRVFSENIGMEFGIEKCAMLLIEKGKIVKSVGIELPDGKVSSRYRNGKVTSI